MALIKRRENGKSRIPQLILELWDSDSCIFNNNSSNWIIIWVMTVISFLHCSSSDSSVILSLFDTRAMANLCRTRIGLNSCEEQVWILTTFGSDIDNSAWFLRKDWKNGRRWKKGCFFVLLLLSFTMLAKSDST